MKKKPNTFIKKPTKLKFQSPGRRGDLSATQHGLGTQLELMVWVQFPASVTGFLCVLGQPPSSAPWLTSSFVQWRSSSSGPSWGWSLLMLLKDMDVEMGRATLGTRARGMRFLPGNDHPCWLYFSVQEQKEWFPDLERVGFFSLRVFQAYFSWSLAAPVQQQAFGVFPVSRLSPLSLSTYGFESFLSARHARPTQTQQDQKRSFCHLPSYMEFS